MLVYICCFFLQDYRAIYIQYTFGHPPVLCAPSVISGLCVDERHREVQIPDALSNPK